MLRALVLLVAVLLAGTARAQLAEPDLRELATRLFGPVPEDAFLALHPMPWGAVPPVPGTSHVLVAQDGNTALFALIAMVQTPGGAPMPYALALGQAGDPADCLPPPGMPDVPSIHNFADARSAEAPGLGAPIITVITADGVLLIGLTWRLSEGDTRNGATAQAVMLFRLDAALLRDAGCVVVRLDANLGADWAELNRGRRRVSSVWRIETGRGQDALLVRDTGRAQRAVPMRLNPETGRFALVVPPTREERETPPQREPRTRR